MMTRTESVVEYLERKRVRDAIDRFVRVPKRVKHPPLLTPIDVDPHAFPIWDEAQEFVGVFVRTRHELNTKRTMFRTIFEPRVDPGLIGTAYDVWLRVLAIKLNRLGKNRFRELGGFKSYLSMDHYRDPEKVCQMDQHLGAFDRFYDGEIADHSDSLHACLYLAQYDTATRTGHKIKSRFHDAVVDQFAKVVRLPSHVSLIGTQVVLSPYFRLSGERVFLEGAGDLVVDGRLYEIKATTEFRIQAAVRQIVCYYMMNKLTREHLGHQGGFDIRELTVVLPRYDFVLSLNPDELFIEDGYAQLSAFLVRDLGLYWVSAEEAPRESKRKLAKK